MNQEKNKDPTQRKLGYTIAIAVNLFFLYVFHGIPDWNIPFLTSDYSKCLYAVYLSLGVTISGNILLLMHDGGKFKAFIRMLYNVSGFIFLYTFYAVYPFDFSSLQGYGPPDMIAKAVLVLGMLAVIIVFIVELIRFLKPE